MKSSPMLFITIMFFIILAGAMSPSPTHQKMFAGNLPYCVILGVIITIRAKSLVSMILSSEICQLRSQERIAILYWSQAIWLMDGGEIAVKIQLISAALKVRIKNACPNAILTMMLNLNTGKMLFIIQCLRMELEFMLCGETMKTDRQIIRRTKARKCFLISLNPTLNWRIHLEKHSDLIEPLVKWEISLKGLLERRIWLTVSLIRMPSLWGLTNMSPPIESTRLGLMISWRKIRNLLSLSLVMNPPFRLTIRTAWPIIRRIAPDSG